MNENKKPTWVHNKEVSAGPFQELLLKLKDSVEKSIADMKNELKRYESIRDNLKGK